MGESTQLVAWSRSWLQEMMIKESTQPAAWILYWLMETGDGREYSARSLVSFLVVGSSDCNENAQPVAG